MLYLWKYFYAKYFLRHIILCNLYNHFFIICKAYALNIPFSFLSMLMGLIDGDGYISITNSNGYIRLQLIISLDISELNLLNYIQSVLKVGRVNVYPNSNTVKYTISRVDLQEIFFPLIVFHNLFFLTDTRRSQFNLAFYILQNNF